MHQTLNMATPKKRLAPKHQVWVDVRKRLRLSHVHIQMARELGLNPKKLGGLANHNQERWKSPLPQFLEELYFERFGKDRPEVVRTIEELAQTKQKQHGSTPVPAPSEPDNGIDDDCPF